MTLKTNKPEPLAIGARVHVRSDHFPEECDAVIREALFDEGWLYRVEVTRGKKPKDATEKDGSVWVCAFEVMPIK